MSTAPTESAPLDLSALPNDGVDDEVHHVRFMLARHHFSAPAANDRSGALAGGEASTARREGDARLGSRARGWKTVLALLLIVVVWLALRGTIAAWG